MGRLKRFGYVCLCFCILGICTGCSMLSNIEENLALAQERRAMEEYASSVNEHGFLVIVDDQEVQTSAYMSDEMHLMMPVGEAVSCLEIQWMPVEEGQTWVDVTMLMDDLGIIWNWDTETYILKIQLDAEEKLPTQYDLRTYRSLNSVEDQGIHGTCWAFASTAALEMMTSVEEGTRFSVDHMTMNNGFAISPTDGGDYNMAIAYLSAWRGPVSEENDPYGDGVTNSEVSAEKHLQEAQILKEKDIDEMKRMIMEYGGLESPIYMSISHAEDESLDYNTDHSAYYYSGDQEANHDVVIVGWDDHFSRAYFNQMPQQDGAFICRNSWGESFGEDGYFYVSYEDVVLGKQAAAYTRLENPDNYTRIYQSDMLGWVGTLGYGAETAWFSNVYRAYDDEVLKAAGFYAVEEESCYDLYVVPDYTQIENLAQRIYVGSGYLEKSGYYTIELEESVRLDAGKEFAMIVCMTTKGCDRPIAIEYAASDLTANAVLDDGKGYVSFDGITWTSAEQEYGCNICLKAFTD